MLQQPLINKLMELRLDGMVRALQEQMESSQYEAFSFLDRLGLMIDREMVHRDNKRLQTRLKKARLRYNATIEDIDFRAPRGLDKQMILFLSNCQWIRERQNCIIIGPTGVGKTYLANALANRACRDGYTAQYARISVLVEDLTIARADGRYRSLMHAYARTDMLILDDWGLIGMTEDERRIIFDVIEDRAELKSTIIVSQIPIEKWHTIIGDFTLGDALLDRIVHSSHKIILKGESLRKKKKALSE
ncbi:IS21-like element helper ATPase IstB [bacterium]|nr:IS21-like element helper ATPase IstB [candidate division CSSED10-310 bacterium]